ncbi:phospholipase D/Transphosphatidylase [Methylobacterium nodulans ORS 2060]|uniref:Phospholipase D n=2 Tax=Methylobacterium nodulans TaxID=114616 RepID=B8ILZ6_METNO|nr:phospholipase D/Transphosphatidylase [Methylobacterium nodulans ORS 2060]
MDHALAEAAPVGLPPTLFEPGRNCWQVARARRAALLVDAAAYFAALDDALRQATRTITIVGWDFDGRIRLREDDAAAPPLGPFLRDLVEARPDLELRILVWSVGTLHGPGAALPLLFGAEWQRHPRIRVKLDTCHPLYAAHHQKIVCIDDSVAFVGGIDLTIQRWDTPAHPAEDPRRIDPDGEPYGPVHDTHMAVDGEAARAVGDLVRARWQAATGEAWAPAEAGPIWPRGLDPDFTEVPVAIARTMPALEGQPSVEEAAALTADMLGRARHHISIEAQYLTARFVEEVLAAQLDRPDGPDIVVVLTRRSHGLAERLAMGAPRDQIIRRLQAADRFGRLFVAYPVVPGPDGDCQVLVHSKLVIVDDVALRVGSSNLNNRSVALDTECDLAIEGRDPATRRTIAALRDRLLAEHLGVAPEAVTAAIRAEGSLVRAIASLNGGKRGLRVFDVPAEDGLIDPLLGADLLDPERPFGT